jgi:hypothetical protein
MFASLLTALVNLGIGLYSANKAAGIAGDKLDQYFKFCASLIGTTLVTFPFL